MYGNECVTFYVRVYSHIIYYFVFVYIYTHRKWNLPALSYAYQYQLPGLYDMKSKALHQSACPVSYTDLLIWISSVWRINNSMYLA